MNTDEAEYREKIRDDDKVAERCARERELAEAAAREAANETPMDAAWREYQESGDADRFSKELAFYNGWIAGKCAVLTSLGTPRPDTLKTD